MYSNFWPDPSPTSAFVARREALQKRLAGPAILASGHARPRNFAANRYPFRADSHFLYLVGAPLEGAALLVEPTGSVLYAAPPDPEEAIWSGRQPSLGELQERLGLPVRSIDALALPPSTATLSPQDPVTADWLEELCDREIVVAGGAEVAWSGPCPRRRDDRAATRSTTRRRSISFGRRQGDGAGASSGDGGDASRCSRSGSCGPGWRRRSSPAA